MPGIVVISKKKIQKKKKKQFFDKKNTKDVSHVEAPALANTPTAASATQKKATNLSAETGKLDAKEAAKKLIQSGVNEICHLEKN
jgi:hypothetical protein